MYRVRYSGNTVPTLVDVDGYDIWPTSTSGNNGNRLMTTAQSPSGVKQCSTGNDVLCAATGAANVSYPVDGTWRALYASATACCREPIPLSEADYNTYVPTPTMTGTSLTVTATRVAPILTYTKVDDIIVSLRLPTTSPLACTATVDTVCTATVDGAVSENSNVNINLNLATVPGIAGASTVTSCAFIPATATFVNGLEACMTRTRTGGTGGWSDAATSSTYTPPSPPPSPPKPPPRPPAPPHPPMPPYVAPIDRGLNLGNYGPPKDELDAGSIAAIILGILFFFILVVGVYILCKVNKDAKERSSIRVPVEINMRSEGV